MTIITMGSAYTIVSTMTLSIMDLIATFNINNNLHNDTQNNEFKCDTQHTYSANTILSIMSLSIKGLISTFSINSTLHNDTHNNGLKRDT